MLGLVGLFMLAAELCYFLKHFLSFLFIVSSFWFGLIEKYKLVQYIEKVARNFT